MFKNTLYIFTLVTLGYANEETAVQTFKDGNKWFAGAVYKQVSTQNSAKNFLVCPFSAETILALAQNGAKGETGEEIRRVLHLPNATEEINRVFRSTILGLRKNEEYVLHTANRIYIKKSYPVKEEFAQVATRIFKSDVENVDFTKKRKAARVINNWVSRHTQNKIRDLIDYRKLNEETVAILINALYFQVNWRKQFKRTLTRRKDFYRSSQETIQVETMQSRDYYNYYESEELKAKFLQIPTRAGRRVSVVFVLPDEVEGLQKLEDRIEEVYATPQFKWEFVEVALPKFKIETSIDFKSVLKNLGMNRAFTTADFSGMAGGKGEIYISDIVQKTYINVNENGVEGAAATAVLFHAKSLVTMTGEQKSFVADHPFLFYVKIDDVVIFTGRVVSPTA